MTKAHKVVMLGDAGVGKTCILERYAFGRFNENHMSTTGVSFLHKKVQLPTPGAWTTLKLWDTAGQEKFRSLATMSFVDAGAIILVYDTTNKASFEALKLWLKAVNDSAPEHALRVIAANKCDLPEQEAVSIDLAMAFAEENAAKFKLVSAKADTGITEMFTDIALALDKGATSDLETIKHIQIKTSAVQKKKKKAGCC
jgi:small GTP-binding protein